MRGSLEFPSSVFGGVRPSRERIVVVKSDRMQADFIARAAREAYPEAEIAVCHSASEAAVCLRAGPARLGLIGLTLPDSDGLDLLARAGRERWFARILVLSGRRDEWSRHRLSLAQIDGFFDCLDDALSELPTAIRRVGEGGNHFGASWRTSATDHDGPSFHRQFTPTELLVFAVIGDGSDNREAADRLGLGETTVQSHRQRLMRKLGVQTRTQLMRAALRRGVVRFTETGLMLTPGLEQALAERATRRREPAPSAAAGFR